MSELITIDRNTFNRMAKALIEVEKFIAVKGSDTWVNEETALELLGCKRTKLYDIKASGEVKYKKVGRGNHYSRLSIEKYNQKYSS
jgi:hypothetical protein